MEQFVDSGDGGNFVVLSNQLKETPAMIIDRVVFIADSVASTADNDDVANDRN
jgi:hypothetical protein